MKFSPLHEAIDRLASLYEGGQLLAATTPEDLLTMAADEIEKSRAATTERAKLAERLLSLVERGLSDGIDVRFAEFADGVHIWARQDPGDWCSVGEGETLAAAVDNAERRDEL